MRQIVFDTETTGLDPHDGHRLVEIGAVEMMNGALTGRKFHVYINPERSMPEEAFNVHQLSEAFLSDKPLFTDSSVGPAFRDFIGEATLVAHNAPFDMGFVQYELEKAGLSTLENDVIDTVKIARKRFPGSPASLDALCNRFGIDLTQREEQGHGALLDARLLAEVYVELTGGAQSGFAFDGRNGVGGLSGDPIEPTPQRDGPRPVLLTEEEKAAHAAFLEEGVDAPVWANVS